MEDKSERKRKMTESDKYFALYKQFRKLYYQVEAENKKLKGIIESCRQLLNGSNPSETTHPSPVLGSNAPMSLSYRRKISFEEMEEDKSDSFEPGENKWECLSEGESERLLILNSKQESEMPTPKKFIKSKNYGDSYSKEPPKLPKTPEHICRWPRCKEHQPFYVSSVRELAKYSPNTSKLATRTKPKSPKGFWDLTIPSPQKD